MAKQALTTPPSAVLKVMRKHGLPEHTARLIASLAYGDAALYEPETLKANH